MILIDPTALERARNRPACEWCHKPNQYGLHAAHVLAKGFGGGSRCDSDFNLCGLCFKCHILGHHAGRSPTRAELIAIVAKREGVSEDQVLDTVYRLLREPKPI